MTRCRRAKLERLEITRQQLEFLRSRVGFLATWPMTDRNLVDLLANAYLLGLLETAEYLAAKEGA